ncbi:MAG: ABC transporter substrate-binding protein [Planctomycetes bacterium]|nr:ABC transporter substrate-binding protein [Planctomycetota bacterium]
MKSFLLLLIISLFCQLLFCTNNPYRESEKDQNIFYTTFTEPPKHFDPARSYSSDEYDFICQIYEPPIQYHYLKFPYELIPLTAESVPVPVYYDKDSRILPLNAPPEDVAKAVYEIKIRKGIFYQNHPCFAKAPDGNFLYHKVSDNDLVDIEEIKDFPMSGTRELFAGDYVLQIKRLCDPRLNCPIYSILKKYIAGMEEYSDLLQKEIDAERALRKEQNPLTYNQTRDEDRNPIMLDYGKFPFEGVQLADRYTYRILLNAKYPQMLYWLAMPFFSPMPQEAVDFYNQGPMIAKNITLNQFPIGTGPYRMDIYNPNMEIVLARNENFREELYPEQGSSGDAENGLLDDARKKMPFIDRAVFKLEKEAVPRWNKFLQGYFDSSGISSDSFDQAIATGSQGSIGLSDYMKERGIRLEMSPRPTVYYYGFNMNDDVAGGYSDEKCRLRQAIAIALDAEERIEIFLNGRGIPAMDMLPPGIFGSEEGKAGINPYAYDWSEARNMPVRKSLDYAKKLMADAGYANGRDSDGNPLIIYFDSTWNKPEQKAELNWMQNKLKAIDIDLKERNSDYNRFQEKVDTGAFQMLHYGWNADYPDPENFLFLLYGPNSRLKHSGENAVNYESPKYDELFTKLERMDNSPERMELIRQIKKVFRHDVPWIAGYHPVAFSLLHEWLYNCKSNPMANNWLKYYRISSEERNEYREKWNKPEYLPVAGLLVFLLIGFLPALWALYRRS